VVGRLFEHRTCLIPIKVSVDTMSPVRQENRKDQGTDGNVAAELLSRGVGVVAHVITEAQGMLGKVSSFLSKNLTSLTIDDFRKFGQANQGEAFSNMLAGYANKAEVKHEVQRVRDLVKSGYLSEDLGEAFIEKITGATKETDSNKHRCIVPLSEVKRTLSLIEGKKREIEGKGLKGDALAEAKSEVSLRVRLSFDDGGMAAVTGETWDRDIKTVLSEKIFAGDALGASHDELWQRYRGRIMELNDASPEEAISYLGQANLKANPERWKRALQDVEGEQAVLRKLFKAKITEEEERRRGESASVFGIYEGSSLPANQSGFGSLLSFIAKGEGGYNSVNRGTQNGCIVGVNHNAGLTGMTIGEIMAAQANGSIFAAGRYQIIPETMKLALRYSGLSLGDQFSPQNQDKMAIALMMYKRPVIGQFLNGDKSISVDQAMMHLAMEWASCPRPDTGSSYYGSGNRALHSVGEVRTALLQAQSQISGKGA
jgi:hypothetical protein